MSRRDHQDARCAVCKMHATLCICALVPQLRTRTALTLLVHYREARKPTNTGQLAARCVVDSTVEIIGEHDRPIPVVAGGDLERASEGGGPEMERASERWQAGPEMERASERWQAGPDAQSILLYPADDAVPISRFADQAVRLIVPDGSWRQASKMRRRIVGLGTIPCVTIEGAVTSYRLRAEPKDGGLATLEAIAAALRILEGEQGPAIEAAMLGVFRVMVERTLWLRGALRDHEVTGGIPAPAIAHDPRGAHPQRADPSAG